MLFETLKKDLSPGEYKQFCMNQEQFKEFVIKNELFVWDYTNKKDYVYNPNEDDKSVVSGLELTKVDIDENMKHYKETSSYLFDENGNIKGAE